MALVPVSVLLRAAEAGNYAVGAFNLNNLEILQSIIAAAEAEQAPVIIQATQGGIKYGGLSYIAAMGRVAAEEASVPVALNLDHGTSFEQAVRCIKAGFSAVMIDGSKLPFDENVALVKKVADVAHAVGVSVETELGKIGGTEDNITVSQREALMTEPGEAAEFVAKSGADALAVSIGTAHGVYHGEPKLDFARLQEIDRVVSIPLVLHGASGVPDSSIREAIRFGIRKINIDTEIRLAFAGSLRELLARDAKVYDPREILGPAREAMQKVVQEKIRLFGASGQAKSISG